MVKLKSSRIYGNLDVHGDTSVYNNLKLKGINPVIESQSETSLDMFNDYIATVNAFSLTESLNFGTDDEILRTISIFNNVDIGSLLNNKSLSIYGNMNLTGKTLNHEFVSEEIEPNLFTWGRNTYGQLGDGTTIDKYFPIFTGNTIWKFISSTKDSTFALRSDGLLFGWGNNSSGQLGDGTTIDKYFPTQISSTVWNKVSGGWLYSLALRNDGILFAWGTNFTGQLGDGTIVDKHVPTQIGSTVWNKIDAGTSHSLALRNDGILFAWGDNFEGQLGDGTQVSKHVPTQIGSTVWNQISSGGTHSLALRNDGILFAWGDNALGALGDGTTVDKHVPTQIGSTVWRKIHAKSGNSFVLREDGILFAWGLNFNGVLGDATTIRKLDPTQIGTTFWNQISGGNTHTIALRSDGILFAWGNNEYGSLGNDTTINSHVPTQIGSSVWSRISAGFDHTSALLKEETTEKAHILTANNLYSGNALSIYSNTINRASGNQALVDIKSEMSGYYDSIPIGMNIESNNAGIDESISLQLSCIGSNLSNTALKVNSGLIISEDITESNSVDTGSVILNGGLGVAGNINAKNVVIIDSIRIPISEPETVVYGNIWMS